MITVSSKGSSQKTEDFLRKISRKDLFAALDRCGKLGVDALLTATPAETGITAHAWYYEVTHYGKQHTVSFYNSNTNQQVSIALILQYGHGTGTGGWVEGTDYINPALQPVFDQILDEIWKQVTNG